MNRIVHLAHVSIHQGPDGVVLDLSGDGSPLPLFPLLEIVQRESAERLSSFLLRLAVIMGAWEEEIHA